MSDFLARLIDAIRNPFKASQTDSYDPLSQDESGVDYIAMEEGSNAQSRESKFQIYLKHFKENEEAYYTTIYECARECKYRTIQDDGKHPLVLEDFYYQMVDADLWEGSKYANLGVIWMMEHHLLCQLIAILYNTAKSKPSMRKWTPLLKRPTEIGVLVAHTSLQVERCIIIVMEKCCEYKLNVTPYDEGEEEEEEKEVVNETLDIENKNTEIE